MDFTLYGDAFARNDVVTVGVNEVKVLRLTNWTPANSDTSFTADSKSSIGMLHTGHHAVIAVTNFQCVIVAHINCVAISEEAEVAHATQMVEEVKAAMNKNLVQLNDPRLRVYVISQCQQSVPLPEGGMSEPKLAYPRIRETIIKELIPLFGLNIRQHSFVVPAIVNTPGQTRPTPTIGQAQFLIQRVPNRSATVYLENVLIS